MFSEIDRYRKEFIELNNDKNLRPEFLHRNKPGYPLISYIQIAFSFLMSDSYDKCVFYIYRANKESEELNKDLNSFKGKEFTDKALKVLSHLQKDLISQGLISEKMIEIINRRNST